MNDQVWSRREIQSPCIKICMIHPEARLCTGCYRTADEITLWSRMSDEERSAIMEELPSRASKLKVRRGGRAARLRSDQS